MKKFNKLSNNLMSRQLTKKLADGYARIFLSMSSKLGITDCLELFDAIINMSPDEFCNFYLSSELEVSDCE